MTFFFKDLVADRELLWETDEKHRLQPSFVKQAVSVCYHTKWQALRRASIYFSYALFYVSIKNRTDFFFFPWEDYPVHTYPRSADP